MCACCAVAVQANAGMTTLFVASLQRLPSLQATVISNAANMAATVGPVLVSVNNSTTLLMLHNSLLWHLAVASKQKRCRQRPRIGAATACHCAMRLTILPPWLALIHTPTCVCTLQPQGLLGHLLFAERITARWALGILLVIAGLLLISASVISTADTPAAAQQQQEQKEASSSRPGTAAAKKHL